LRKGGCFPQKQLTDAALTFLCSSITRLWPGDGGLLSNASGEQFKHKVFDFCIKKCFCERVLQR